MNKREEIEKFVYSDNSLVQKAKRYDNDIKFLLEELMHERRRHARCEEEMLDHNPSYIAKIQRLKVLDEMFDIINHCYDKPFLSSDGMNNFKDYVQTLSAHNLNTIDLNVLKQMLLLIYGYYNQPAAC